MTDHHRIIGAEGIRRTRVESYESFMGDFRCTRVGCSTKKSKAENVDRHLNFCKIKKDSQVVRELALFDKVLVDAEAFDPLKKNRVDEEVAIRKKKHLDLLSKRRNLNTAEDDATSSSPPLSIECEFALLREIVQMARSLEVETQLYALQQVRMLLCPDSFPLIDEYIDEKLLSVITSCLGAQNANVKYQAAFELSGLITSTFRQQTAVRAGAVPLLLKLLSVSNDDTCELTLTMLKEIIQDGPHFRDYCIQLGIIDSLHMLISPGKPDSLIHEVSTLILNLCNSKDALPTPEIVRMLLPALGLLIHHTDTNILVDTVWALSYLTDGGNEQIQMIIDCGVVPYLIPLLGHGDVKVQTAALRAVGNIVTGTDDQTQLVLDNNVLMYMPALLSHYKKKINKEAVWFLSNITAGNENQVQAVIDAGLLPMIITLLNNGDFHTQKEAAWAVSNVTISGRDDQVAKMVEAGVIAPFCQLLSIKDPQIIQVVLDGINNILKMAGDNASAICAQIEECDGLDRIEHLLNPENKEIYKLAYEIIDTYFSTDSDDGQQPGPAGKDSFSFDPSGEVLVPDKGWSFQ